MIWHIEEYFHSRLGHIQTWPRAKDQNGNYIKICNEENYDNSISFELQSALSLKKDGLSIYDFV